MSQFQPKCERCKAETAAHHCDLCQPFHYFCSKCDTTIHSFPSKSTHSRINVLSPQSSNMTYQYTLNQQDYNSNFNNNNQSPINTVTKESIAQSHIDMSCSEYGLIYTREYVNELKRLFEKEKGELQFKIVSMQNNIDRLKETFQAQMQKVQDDSMITFNKTKHKEEDYENRIRSIIRDKSNVINQLIEENNAIKALNNEFNTNLNKHIDQTRDTSSCYNKQIETLKQEIDNLNKAKTKIHQDTVNEVQSLIKSNKNEIESIKEKHEKEMSDKTYEFKYHQEQLRNEIEMKMKEIKELNDQNNEYRILIDDLTQHNVALVRDIDLLKTNCNTMSLDINQLNQRNEMLNRSIEKEKNDGNQMRDDFNYFEKTISNLKNEIALLKDANYKLESDYDILMCQSEKMRRDFSEKIFNVSNCLLIVSIIER